MNDSSFDYLIEFYGSSSATYFAIYLWTVSLFIILSDSFFISMTLTTASLRKHKANFLLVGFCLADLLHCVAHLVDAYAIWTGSRSNRGSCKVAGALVILISPCRFGFPALIAANRYYKISAMPGQTPTFGQKLFSERATVPLIIGWYCFSYCLYWPLIVTDSFGEALPGYCGTKPFTSVGLLASYVISTIAVYPGGIALAGIYYFRLAKWLQQNQSVSNQETVDYTRSLMLVMKFETLLPLITALPTAVVIAGQMVLPVMPPMWLMRLLMSPFLFASFANPWLTIYFVRPFRRRFGELISSTVRRADIIQEMEDFAESQNLVILELGTRAEAISLTY